jgi:hypothetical protein
MKSSYKKPTTLEPTELLVLHEREIRCRHFGKPER